VSDVRDIVDGLVLLGERGVAGEAYNLCAGTARSLRALVEALGGVVEEDPALARPGTVPVFLGTAAKAEALGWTRRYALEVTLAELRASYAR
ncbi:MAG: hypothetical protein ACK4YP_13660, partial [Myxococcota bacterium]